MDEHFRFDGASYSELMVGSVVVTVFYVITHGSDKTDTVTNQLEKYFN